MDCKKDYVGLICKVTGEEEWIVNNTLKTINSRVKGVDDVVKLLESNGVEAEGKSANQIINELAQKWNQFNEDKRVELSRSIAGLFNVSRFTVLMNELSKEV